MTSATSRAALASRGRRVDGGRLGHAAVSLEYRDSPESLANGEAAEPASRLALGLVAGLVAVLVPGEASRLATQELTWPALLGR